MGGIDERNVELDAGPPKITPADLYRKMRKDKRQKAEVPSENQEVMEDINDIPIVPEHKFA